MNVSNRKCIYNLSRKSLRANRVRNLVAVLAIILTTVLFNSLFTIAGTIVNSFQQQSFRQVGGDMHGTFKNVTEEQIRELSGDPLIVKTGIRLTLGMPTDPPFNKTHVEVSYMDANCAKGYFCVPEQGSLPQEGTDQIACDTRILQLLGITPEIGAKITLPYYMGINGEGDRKKLVTDTFTLSGWWEYDPASMASMAVVPLSYAKETLSGYERNNKNDVTGQWDLNIYLKSSLHIESDLIKILNNHGYQNEDMRAENYIATGVNWAYVGAQFSNSLDFGMIAAIVVLLILIVFTGYLIIYNIFQISVSNDIRFYGLLKTIGTTPRQIQRIIRQQALLLSLIGIPIGLIAGYIVGNLLTPVIMNTLSYSVTHVTVNPLIFIGAALFSFVTVLLSSNKPGKIAGSVSPIEAIRYTEGHRSKASRKKGKDGGKIPRMALTNLGRNRKKTVLVVLSLSLAVVLFQMTCTFASGFDMNKYLRKFVVTDFILGDAEYFQVGGDFFNIEQAVPEEDIAAVEAQGDITGSGRVYGRIGAMQELVSEDWFRQKYERRYNEEALNQLIESSGRAADGRITSSFVDVYGMEPYALDHLTVIDGSLDALYDPNQNTIAAVYMTDDYDNPQDDSNWAKVGDQVTLRYIDEMEYYDARTGQTGEADSIPEDYLQSRAAKYRDVTYTVAACVTVRSSMSYRYYAGEQFVLNAEVFQRDSGTSAVMNYLFDTADESEEKMKEFLENYTENVNISLDYESKQSYSDEFESLRGMFMMLGGTLSFIIGLIGILNFFNAILTSIFTRKREFAVLQSIGMTGGQLKAMLVWEGVFYAALTIIMSLVLNVGSGLLLGKVITGMFWFFTYHFSLIPTLCVIPVFLLLGTVLPLIVYRNISRQSIVERLREAE